MTSTVETDAFARFEAAVLGGLMAGGSREEARTEAFTADAEAVRDAARTVWYRRCNRHGCTEGPDCVHPNHRRDVHALRLYLEVLGVALAPDDDWDSWFRGLYTAS